MKLLRMIYYNVSQFFTRFDCGVTINNGLSSLLKYLYKNTKIDGNTFMMYAHLYNDTILKNLSIIYKFIHLSICFLIRIQPSSFPINYIHF